MAQVSYVNATCIYANNPVPAVNGLNLEIADGEFMVLVGPSGSGKSTALRMLAGLEPVSGGTVQIGGDDVSDKAPKDRDIAMVFQNYALYPHMSVAENMGFALKLRGVEKKERQARVHEAAAMLDLEEYLGRRPGALSGGQRQRVAMGRAVVREPSVFLMAEPLSNLDAKLRTQMRAEISLLHKELGITTLYVTHDQVEAMTLGQRVAVLRKGELQQVAAPQELYDRPVNLFVAGFIGSPSMNFVQGTIEEAADSLRVALGNQRLAVDTGELVRYPSLRSYVGRKVIVGVRPDHLEDAALARDTPEDRRLTGLVRLKEALGSEVIV